MLKNFGAKKLSLEDMIMKNSGNLISNGEEEDTERKPSRLIFPPGNYWLH